MLQTFTGVPRHSIKRCQSPVGGHPCVEVEIRGATGIEPRGASDLNKSCGVPVRPRRRGTGRTVSRGPPEREKRSGPRALPPEHQAHETNGELDRCGKSAMMQTTIAGGTSVMQ